MFDIYGLELATLPTLRRDILTNQSFDRQAEPAYRQAGYQTKIYNVFKHFDNSQINRS